MSVFAVEAKRQWAEREEAVAAAGGELRYLEALRLQKGFDSKKQQTERAHRAQKAQQAQQVLERLARMGLTRVQVVEPRQPGESTPQYKQRIKEHLQKKRLENLPN